jgi:hypothetical protein
MPSEEALKTLNTPKSKNATVAAKLMSTRDRVLGSNTGVSSQGSKNSSFPRTTTQEMHNAE